MTRLVRAAMAPLLFLAAAAAHAGPLEGVVAQIDQNSGFGFGVDFTPCYTLSTSAAIGSGIEQVGVSGTGCVGYFDVDIDPVANTLTLTGRQNGNYEVGRLSITGLASYGVAGVTLLSDNLIDPNAYGGSVYTADPAPTITFTSDSIAIEYSAEGIADGQFSYGNGDIFTAVFQISAVPEPATAALWLLGLGAFGAAARRRRG